MELIKSFIKQNKTISSSINFEHTVFVMGNTGSDMDSVLSSILLSFALNISNCVLDVNHNLMVSKKSVIYLPLINTEKLNFSSILDIKYLFKSVGIDYNDLLYLEDVKNKILSNIEKTSLILVDHNKLDPSQVCFLDKVISIYDHHEESSTKYPFLQKKIMQYPLGSCTTLILMNHYITDETLMKMFKNQDLEFLCAAIWNDTRGFDKTLKKVRWIDLDLYVYNKISSYGKINENFFIDLENVKYDIKSNLDLGIECLMKKDLKNFEYCLSQDFMLCNELEQLDSSNNKYKVLVKFASLSIDYCLFSNHFGEENILTYFGNQKCQLFVTNSEHKKKYRLVSIYINIKDSIFNSKMSEMFIDQLMIFAGSNIIEFVDTKIPFYHILLMNLEENRKTIEPKFRKVFEN